MCLATPVKVKKIIGHKAEIEGGEEVDISLISDLQVGDYLLVHADLGINKLDKKEAEKIIELTKNCRHNQNSG